MALPTVALAKVGLPDEVPFRERRLVEAMGIEPMSALRQDSSATCLFSGYTHLQRQRKHKTNESA